MAKVINSKHAHGDYDCRVCGQFSMSGRVELVNVYHTVLCVNCLNVWHKFISAHDSCREFDELQAKIQVVQCQIIHDGNDRTSDLMVLRDGLHIVRERLYHIAEEWVNAERANQ